MISSMDQKNLIKLFRDQAQLISIDPDIVQAIMMQETNANNDLARYEPTWKYLVNIDTYALKLGISKITEQVLQSTSWGAMQLMGSVAREMGFDGMLTTLVYPDNAVKYSLKKLGKLMKIYESDDSVIASWNAGSPRKIGSVYTNQPYVDGVNKFLKQIKANR